jgi:hypothetical protein
MQNAKGKMSAGTVTLSKAKGLDSSASPQNDIRHVYSLQFSICNGRRRKEAEG